MSGSRSFKASKPYKQHLIRGSGGVQAEVRDLREDIDCAFMDLEQSGQLALFKTDTVPPTVTDDDTQGFDKFSQWLDTTTGMIYECVDPSTGAAVWHEITNFGVVPGGLVASVFGRTGIVVAAAGDYLASLVTNDSGVAGAFVSDALDTLAGLIPPVAPVDSVHGRVGMVVGVAGDYAASLVTNDSGVPGALVDAALDYLDANKAGTTTEIIAGAGIVGGGDLSANRTLDVGAHPDGSIVVGADTVRVGVLASDAQHGNLGGGALHPDATPVSSGFMSFSDKAKLNSIEFGAEVNVVTSVFGRTGDILAVLNDYAASLIDNDSTVSGATVKDALESLDADGAPTSRLLTAGAGLVGGGDLTADRTFDVAANPDGSIVVNPDDIQVGVLASDAQHGVRGGGTQHAIVTGSVAGFMSPADKIKLDGIGGGAISSWQEPVLDKDLTAPPGGPSPNDRYIVASPASGAWTGQENSIAQWNGVSWDFIPPVDGMTTHVLDEDLYYTYHPGDDWHLEIASVDTQIIAGAGLTGGGDLTTDRTLDVAANADGSIVVNADDIQVGILATDAQHGSRGGGTQHAVAIASGAAGFLSGADKQLIDDLVTTYVPLTRNLVAGAGLAGGGDLSADRTFNVGANADGSIVVNADDVQVGVLATDAQHGTRGGGTQHALVVAAGAAGFMSGADKSKLDGVETGATAPRFVESVFQQVSVDTTTTSVTFVTLMTQVINMDAGNNLLITFTTGCSNTANNATDYFRLVVDGTPYRGSAYTSSGANNPGSVALLYELTGLTAGNHTVVVQWRVSSGTGQIRPITAADSEHASLVLQELAA